MNVFSNGYFLNVLDCIIEIHWYINKLMYKTQLCREVYKYRTVFILPSGIKYTHGYLGNQQSTVKHILLY